MPAHVLRGVPARASLARGAAVAHQLPRVPSPDARARLSDTEPTQQHQGHGGLSSLHRLGPFASRCAAAPPASPPSCARGAQTRGGRVRCVHRGTRDAVHHDGVHRDDAVPRLRLALRELPQLQAARADRWMRVRHLLLPFHARALVHGPDIRAQPRRAALARGTALPVCREHPRHGLRRGYVAPLLAQVQTGARDRPRIGHCQREQEKRVTEVIVVHLCVSVREFCNG